MSLVICKAEVSKPGGYISRDQEIYLDVLSFPFESMAYVLDMTEPNDVNVWTR